MIHLHPYRYLINYDLSINFDFIHKLCVFLRKRQRCITALLHRYIYTYVSVISYFKPSADFDSETPNESLIVSTPVLYNQRIFLFHVPDIECNTCMLWIIVLIIDWYRHIKSHIRLFVIEAVALGGVRLCLQRHSTIHKKYLVINTTMTTWRTFYVFSMIDVSGTFTCLHIFGTLDSLGHMFLQRESMREILSYK